MYTHDLNEVVDWVAQCFKQSIDIKLYEKQKTALYKLLEGFDDKKEVRGVFQLPTGAGKTIVIAGLIMALYRLKLLQEGSIVLYLTPRKPLKNQVEYKFEKIFSIFKTSGGYELFRIEKPESDMAGWLEFFLIPWDEHRIPVLIFTPNALHDFVKKYENEFYKLNNIKRVKLIIMDEVHRAYFGPEFFKSIEKLIRNQALENSIVIGLSATPIRQAIEHVGPLIYTLSSRQAMEEGILVSRLKIYPMNTVTLLEGIDKDEWEVAVIERAERYSEKILEKISEELKDFYHELPANENSLSKRIPKTLIVAANTTEANEIAQNLRNRISEARVHDNVDELVRVAHYKVAEALEEIERFRERDEGVLVTVNMADIGFDDENLEVLVIARPVKTPVAYTQIRGRVLRRPKITSNNLKASKYAVLIDLTEASKHEESVTKVELGEFALKDFDDLEYELRGRDEVPRMHGKVKIEEHRPFEVPKPSTPIDKIEKEVLSVLRLPHGLSPDHILKKLLERECNVYSDDVEKACLNLAEQGKLTMRFSTWFYLYDIRKDILQAGEDKVWSMNELMEEAGIPLMKKEDVGRILKEIIEEALDKQTKFCISSFLPDLSKMVKIVHEDLVKLIPPDYLELIQTPGKCPRCGSYAKGNIEHSSTKELRIKYECPECKTCFIDNYEMRGSLYVLVSKGVVKKL